MTRYLSAVGMGVWLWAVVLCPQQSRADEERERHLKVEQDDDGYEVREKETRHSDKKHDDKVRVEERVEKNESGDEVYRREKKVERDDD